MQWFCSFHRPTFSHPSNVTSMAIPNAKQVVETRSSIVGFLPVEHKQGGFFDPRGMYKVGIVADKSFGVNIGLLHKNQITPYYPIDGVGVG